MTQANRNAFAALRGWPKRFVLMGALLAVIAAGLVAWGYLLPETVTVTRHVTLAAPPSRVWQALTDVSSLPRRLPYVKRVTLTQATPEALAWAEEWRNGATVAWETTEVRPETRLVARFAVADASLGGTRAWDLAADPAGTSLTVTDRLAAEHPLVRLVVRFFGATRLTDEYVADLSRDLTP